MNLFPLAHRASVLSLDFFMLREFGFLKKSLKYGLRWHITISFECLFQTWFQAEKMMEGIWKMQAESPHRSAEIRSFRMQAYIIAHFEKGI